MNLDLYLFNLINGFAGNWEWFDYAGIICAKYLEYLLWAMLVWLLIWNFKKYWRIILEGLFVSSVIRFVIVETIRFLWFRPRPFVSLKFLPLIEKSADEAAFPSGHASFYFALSTVIYLYNKKLGIFFYVCTALITLARIFVGVHWPLDILVGAVIGIVVAVIADKLFLKFYVSKQQ